MDARLLGGGEAPARVARAGAPSNAAPSSGAPPSPGTRRRGGGARRGSGPGGRELVLVANARASGVEEPERSVEAARRLLCEQGARVEAQVTSSLEELAAASAAAEGRRLVLLGGDGSLHAAANLPQLPAEVALLPAGRANNVARSLGIPRDLHAAAELAARGSATGTDLIVVSAGERRRLAVEGVSVGFHALARAGYHSPNSADVAAGFRVALAAARRFEGVTLQLEVDGIGEVVTVGQLFVANLPLYAFGLRVAPAARPDDGRFDLVALEATRRRAVIPMLMRLRRGTHVGRRDTDVLKASRLRIETSGSSPIIVDTEDLGTGPAELSALPRALQVVRPR